MSNVKISNLPLYTGNTDGGYLIFNNSGETESFKINKSELFFISNVIQGFRSSGPANNISVVLQPKGSGSFSLEQPDGTIIGGNVRGSNAIDLQMSRDNANQVASGDRSIILNGFGNRVAGADSGAFGVSNLVTGQQSFAFGLANNISANQVIAVGVGNIATAGESSVFGRGCVVTANYSLATGNDSHATAESSFAMGTRALTYTRAQFARSNQMFSVNGDNQDSIIGVQAIGSYAPSANITLFTNDNAGLLTFFGNNRSLQINCRFNLVCTVSGGGVNDPAVGNVFGGEQVFMFKEVGGILTQVGTTSTIHSNADPRLVGTTFTQSVGGSNNLVLRFTLPATTNNNTYRANATLSITEIGW